MNTRIKKVRQDYGLTQAEFGAQMDVTRNYIAQIEIKAKVPSDRMVREICRTYSVSEKWLRTGDGEQYVTKDVNDYLLVFLNTVIRDGEESIRKRVIYALSKLTTEDWKKIDAVLSMITKKGD